MMARPMRWLAATTVATVLLLMCTGAQALAGRGGTTCEYVSSTHKVKVSAPAGATIKRTANGHINVNDTWCGTATVYNTDSIRVLSGAGTQFVVLYLDNGGFKPGFTDEPGTSDEIEISISLGGDNDSFVVYGSDTAADNIVIGKSSGFGVMGKMNLNANETTGIDADLTLIVGVEERVVLSRGGQDDVSGGGGAGTGDAADFLLKLGGGNAGDQLTGGTVKDSIIGGDGPDVLKGAGGPDFIDSNDGVSGNDQIFGGNGSDSCNFDSGDSVTSCP
jgi:hypothetical protein